MATAAALNWKEQCQNLLDILNRSDDSRPFRKPISILDLPDYLQVIDHPMDLQTIGEKLRDGHYATPSDFSNDVRLIIDNSMIYNTDRNSMIYGQTDRLSKLFDEEFRKILASYGNRKTAVQSKSKTDGHIFLPASNLFCCCFLDKSNSQGSRKGKSLAPTNSNKGIQVRVEGSKETTENVPSRANKRQQVKNEIPS